MAFKTPQEILADANTRNLRRALVVTALPVEMQAARSHLTELGSSVGRSGTIYECGQFSGDGTEWLVIVAECGAGNHPAQSVVTYAHIDFVEFEAVLFVGVAGSRKSDAPIGSVIASSYVYNPYSGKYGPTGFSSRPHSLPIDNRLIQLARKVSRDGDWHGRIMAPLNGALPTAENYPKPFPPGSFVAPIVAVEAIAADPESELERMIGEFNGDAHAVEMEGYGAAFAASVERTPVIVIRGISDMTTEKTPEGDAIQQPVAAAHATAFGFELLSLWGMANSMMPPPIATPSEAKSDPSTYSAPKAQATSTRLVLNFEGDESDFSEDKMEAIVEAVRNETGNSTIRVIGSESGSFRLLIEATSLDHQKLKSERLRAVLAAEQDVKLLGIVDEPTYRQAQSLQDSLLPASQELLAWPRELPDGTWLDRPELSILLKIVEEEQSSTTVLLGSPGSGKSALLSTFCAELVGRGWPILGIKADLLDPQVRSEDDLQEHLGLTERPSDILKQVSELQPVILVIDQLDALAGYLDLRTGRLSVLLNLVRRLARRQNIHIVLSARTFEFEHDVRLRSVSAESITLELPAWHTVLNLIEARGVQASGWPADAQEVLRSPQALSTFLQINANAISDPFRNYQQMLDRLWSERILQGDDGPRLVKLVSKIAETMAEEENLWLSAVRFEDQIDDLLRLEASGILTAYRSDGRIGFSHQTLFDHALARNFARGKGRLSSYILARQNSLFIRPKIWAGLTYLRGVELSTYEAELETIWSGQRLRPHLRHLLVDFIGQQTTPTDREAALMTRTLRTDQQLGLRALTGSPGWFERTAEPFIAGSMTSDQSSATFSVSVLRPAWDFAPDQVLSLILKHWVQNPEFDNQVWATLDGCRTWTNDILGLGKTVLGRTDIAPFSVDNVVATIGVDRPDVALQLAAAALYRDLARARDESARRQNTPRPESGDTAALIAWDLKYSPSVPLNTLLKENRDWDSLPALAEAAPSTFIEVLWPWYQEAFTALRSAQAPHDGGLGFANSYTHVDFQFDDELSSGLPEYALLEALRTAVEHLAAEHSDLFLTWLSENEAEDSNTVQRLFAHALASQPNRYAEQSLSFLLSDPRCFYLGSIEDGSATTRRLIRTAAPFWTDEDIHRFESAVHDFNPTPPAHLENAKSRQSFMRLLRRVRLGLLKALPADRTDLSTRNLIAEEARAFPDASKGARLTGVQWIGSPMEADAMSRASDDDIVNAFRVLPDDTDWDHPKSWHSGGNIQLSRAFAEFAKSNPERAATLIAQFEPSFGTRAAGYALDSMAETADGLLVEQLFVEVTKRGFDNEEFRSSAAHAIGRLVRRKIDIGDDILGILEEWLTQETQTEAGGESEELDTAPNVMGANGGEEKEEEVRSILWDNFGFATLPHGNYPVLETLTLILLNQPDHDRLAAILECHLNRPEDYKVWNALLRYFVYLKPSQDDVRPRILRQIFYKFPELVRSREAIHILAHAQWWAPDFVREMLEAWSTSEDPFLSQAYGELVALVAIAQPSADWAKKMLVELLERPKSGKTYTGAAFSAVNLWNDTAHRPASAQLLTALIPIADKETWVAIFDLFRVIDELTPETETVRILKVMAEHLPGVRQLDSTFVVTRLETMLPHEALLVGKIAQVLVANWQDDLSDTRTGTAAAAPQLVDLAITLHRLAPDTREIGTALFEDLLTINAYMASETLDEIDNRFKPQRRPVRRRLPRRSARRQRIMRAASGKSPTQ